jgi:hypothetical protein
MSRVTAGGESLMFPIISVEMPHHVLVRIIMLKISSLKNSWNTICWSTSIKQQVNDYCFVIVSRVSKEVGINAHLLAGGIQGLRL